jgi:hypothetical protein
VTLQPDVMRVRGGAGYAVFLDRGFRGNDQLKANAAKLFASKAGDHFKKFKTV